MSWLEASAPATSANLGPGFDALAAALDLRNRFLVDTGRRGGEWVAQAGALPDPRRNLFRRGFTAAFRERGERAPDIFVRAEVAVPPSSGLGSSASAIAAGIVGANLVLENPLDPSEMLRIAARLDGHPDNVAAALLGGVTLAVVDDGMPLWHRLPAPGLTAALWFPPLSRSTREVRRRLPARVPLSDAVHGLAHTALLFHALATADDRLLAAAAKDRLHEPYRLPEIPGAEEARAAALSAGALAVTLSGSGPALLAICRLDAAAPVAEALRGVRSSAQDAQVFELSFTNLGAEAHRL